MFATHKIIRLLIGLLLLFAVFWLLTPVYYFAKAGVAQYLLEDAWESGVIENKPAQKPWPWADTWPVAKLTLLKAKNNSGVLSAEFKKLDSFIVLADASGESLAFGPGLLTRNLMPGEKGNSLIAAHRDTHFSILKKMLVNDKILVELADGSQVSFMIDDIRIIDSTLENPLIDIDEYRLTLVTCYPFNMQVKNPKLRLLVSGVKTSD